MNLPISIRGARQHNLRNLNLDLPSNKLIVFCGPSGSGKSSLAFDTLFSESRRRFLDCLSARSRQGMDQPEKPEVDSITGLPPALCLEQSARQQSSRTLLGSITEILDYLRILYAAAGTPHDPETGKELERKSPDRITEELVSLPEHTRLILTAPAENLLAQDPAATLGDFQRQGFLRVYWNGEMRDIEEISSPVPPPPDAALVIDRLIVRGENTASRIADSLQTALRINPDEVRAIITIPGEEASIRAFHTRYRNPETGFLLPQLTPRHFSFNSPLGACPSCRGTGLNEQENGPCRACGGQRLSPLALAVTMPAPDRAYNLAELTALPLEDMAGELERLKTPSSLAAALTPLMEEINKRVRFLNELGLSYLSLDRQANTLSGGELQRARLASQLGGGLSGVLYILDEPTAGLHPADTDRLLRALRTLRNQGNTVLVVEHDEQILTAADHLVDMGPGSGTNGGRILAQGSLAEILENAESPTGEWLSGKRNMPGLRTQDGSCGASGTDRCGQAQPQQRHSEYPGRHTDLHLRPFRFREIHPCPGLPHPRSQARSLREKGYSAPRAGNGTLQPPRRHRPVAHRQNAALHTGHRYRPAPGAAPPLRTAPPFQAEGIYGGALFPQHSRRPL